MMKKSIFILLLALFSFSILPQSAQAGPILSQELLLDDPTGPIPIGWLAIDLDYIIAGEVTQWQTFTMFGFDMGTSFGFFAEYDALNLGAGFTFLQFDVSDLAGIFAFQGLWDINFAPGFLDVFTTDGDLLFAESLVLGSVSVVSEPATTLLFLIGAGGLLLRRRYKA